ncbi:MAG: ribose-phosphate pyrophosphokinase-like domain-containing protein [Hydrogenophaga sp.]|nr:ribose-phosphate pyrophosphokinase-like domain-containing protein [Hydrogenophaga sp.]
MLIFSIDQGTALAHTLSARLAQPLADFEDRAFDDGEHKWRPLCDPRAQHVFVLASLHARPDASPHDALCRLSMKRVPLADPAQAVNARRESTQPAQPLAP